MSRDATGIWTAWAVGRVTCPVCGALPRAECDLKLGLLGYVEHDTHFERVEADSGEVPPESIIHVPEPRLETLEGKSCSLSEWLDANRDLLPEDLDAILNLEPGEIHRGIRRIL